MAGLSTTFKREAATTAWTLWINSITGESPIVTRTPDSVEITWKPGQAKRMEQYFSDAMKPSEPDPDALNVNVALAPVLIPLLIKKYIGYAALYTTVIVIGTKLIWK